MPIYLFDKAPPTAEQVREMLEACGDQIKVAVDIRRNILAGGGAFHADAEQVLLSQGSLSKDIWGAGWVPASRVVLFEALINIRPAEGNRSMDIQDRVIHKQVEDIVRSFFLPTQP